MDVGKRGLPPKVYLDIPEHGGDFRAMPAALGDAAGLKWVSVYPDNPGTHKLPSVLGLYILNHPDTSIPAAVMDATLLTGLRTGAAAAVASKYLFAGTPRTLGLIGCGVQARTLLAAHRVVYGDDAFTAKMADIRRSAAERLADEEGGEAVSLEEAAACDIVCTATPTRVPIVRRSWLSDGVHINAMGADAEGKQELETAIVTAAALEGRLVVDDPAQAHHSGEVNVPIAKGELAAADAERTLGAIVAGRAARLKGGRGAQRLRLDRARHPGRGHRAGGVRAGTGRWCRPVHPFSKLKRSPCRRPCRYSDSLTPALAVGAAGQRDRAARGESRGRDLQRKPQQQPRQILREAAISFGAPRGQRLKRAVTEEHAHPSLGMRPVEQIRELRLEPQIASLERPSECSLVASNPTCAAVQGVLEPTRAVGRCLERGRDALSQQGVHPPGLADPDGAGDMRDGAWAVVVLRPARELCVDESKPVSRRVG